MKLGARDRSGVGLRFRGVASELKRAAEETKTKERTNEQREDELSKMMTMMAMHREKSSKLGFTKK